MKKTLLSLLVMSFSLTMNAAVITVNNTPGGAGQFSEIDPAMAVANPTDTIYVHGSAYTYADATITKSITLIGPGGFPQTQLEARANIHNIFFTSNISNIKVAGFYLWAVRNTVTNVHNVDITNNCFPYTGNYNIPLEFPNLVNCSDWIIHNNSFGQNWSNPVVSSNGGCFNFIIEHNLFDNTNTGQTNLTGFNIPNGVIQHNTFIFPASDNNVFSGISNAIISNNIFYNCNPASGVSTSVFNNNITYDAGITLPPLGGTNLDNTDPQFVNVNIAAPLSMSNNYNVQATGPAHNAASDGTDIGYYGGPTNLNITPTGEVYNMPVIRVMDIQNISVPQNGNVNVKVRSTKSRTN